MVAAGLGLSVMAIIISGGFYLAGPPRPAGPPLYVGRRARRWLAAGLHAGAYLLTILRLPFGVLPYVGKIVLALLAGARFEAVWECPAVQILRGLGDGLNLGLTAALLAAGPAWLQPAAQTSLAAEIVRLGLEKGLMAMSALWQALPHRRLAAWARQSGRPGLRAYAAYYGRAEAGRLAYLGVVLQAWSAAEPEAAARLRYVRGWRVVADRQALRAGRVRDVAGGDLFIHARWTNDPWLLLGLALRRGPWLFDPRCLRRPFFYRSEANPRATRFVLENFHYSPPFAVYQLGHEIKAARFELFFRAARWLGRELEAPVAADGVYRFDPALRWLRERLGAPPARPAGQLLSAAEMRAACNDPAVPAAVWAARFTVPQLYVEEVLLPPQACAKTEATVSGVSQCG